MNVYDIVSILFFYRLITKNTTTSINDMFFFFKLIVRIIKKIVIFVLFIRHSKFQNHRNVWPRLEWCRTEKNTNIGG